jgi:hypothetical protein
MELLLQQKNEKYHGLSQKWQGVLRDYDKLKVKKVTPKSILESVGVVDGELLKYSYFTQKNLKKNNELKIRIEERAKDEKYVPNLESFWEDDYKLFVARYDEYKKIFLKLSVAEVLYLLHEETWCSEDANVLRHAFGSVGGDEDIFQTAYRISNMVSDVNVENSLRTYSLIREMKDIDDIIPTNTYVKKIRKNIPLSSPTVNTALPEDILGLAFKFRFKDLDGNNDEIYFDNPLGLYVENDNGPVFWASFIPDYDKNALVVNQLQGKKGMLPQESSLMDYTKFLLDLIAKLAINTGFDTIKIRPAIANQWIRKTYEGTTEAHASYEQLWRIYDRKALEMSFSLDENGFYVKKLTK